MSESVVLRLLSVLLASLVAGVAARAQAPGVDELLDRTGAHLRTYVPRLANIVCEEEYVQERRARPA